VDREWKHRYYLFFDEVRLPWYVAVDVASAAFGATCCGLVPLLSCEVPMYFMCAAALLQLIVAAVGNVGRTLLTNGLIVSIQLCTFVSYGCLIVLRHRGDKVPQWVSVLGSTQSSIQYTKSLLDIVVLAQYLYGVALKLAQKRREQRAARDAQQQAAQGPSAAITIRSDPTPPPSAHPTTGEPTQIAPLPSPSPSLSLDDILSLPGDIPQAEELSKLPERTSEPPPNMCNSAPPQSSLAPPLPLAPADS